MSVAKKVKDYVEKRPYIKDSLSKEIINYSALARQIGKDIEGSHEAIKISLRRLKDDIEQERNTRKKNIGKVMKGTTIKLEGSVQICKTSRSKKGIISAKTENGHTTIQGSEKTCNGDKIKDQVLITLESPKTLEKTPGALNYILSILASKNINITELISCREDTHLVIDQNDATKAFKLLNDKLNP